MVTVCHPTDEIEQIILVATLQEACIPYFIKAQYFGGLYPGLQIPWYNERAIQVHPLHCDDAIELIKGFRKHYSQRSESLTLGSTLRVVAEAAILGWSVPANNKQKSGS